MTTINTISSGIPTEQSNPTGLPVSHPNESEDVTNESEDITSTSVRAREGETDTFTATGEVLFTESAERTVHYVRGEFNGAEITLTGSDGNDLFYAGSIGSVNTGSLEGDEYSVLVIQPGGDTDNAEDIAIINVTEFQGDIQVEEGIDRLGIMGNYGSNYDGFMVLTGVVENTGEPVTYTITFSGADYAETLYFNDGHGRLLQIEPNPNSAQQTITFTDADGAVLRQYNIVRIPD